MREIKFRAWDDTDKKWLPVTVLWVCSVTGEVAYPAFYFNGEVKIIVQDHDIHLLQSTSLKDKNGIEIYEGDILVYYLMDHNGDEECYREEVKWGVKGFDLTFPTSSYEVIGNIYENGDLLDNTLLEE